MEFFQETKTCLNSVTNLATFVLSNRIPILCSFKDPHALHRTLKWASLYIVNY